ncbi:MAG: hypothetical protein HUJ68_03530 [Clostridia bacterium]|nr:hypothetical protein [Clostridia bacterium]
METKKVSPCLNCPFYGQNFCGKDKLPIYELKEYCRVEKKKAGEKPALKN